MALTGMLPQAPLGQSISSNSSRRIERIMNAPTCIRFEDPCSIHQSMYRNNLILDLVSDMIKRGDSPETLQMILDLRRLPKTMKHDIDGKLTDVE